MIDALVTGMTQIEAAAAAGVSRATVQRWLRLPMVRQALHDAQAAAVEEAATAAVARMRAAVETIEKVMSDGDAPAQVRLSAARELLAAGGRLYELTVFGERLTRLETQLGVR
jgi:transcriptional regulator with XRE-family HTH domain